MSDKKERTEIELKLSLPSFADYLKLIGFIGEAKNATCQKNIFYDTYDRKISALGYALRMRIESNRAIITLKSTTVQKGKAAIRNEIEETIFLEQALLTKKENSILELDICPIQHLLAQTKNFGELKPILQFENERIKKEIRLGDNSYMFEIDKTTYANGQIDYELEVELTSVEKIESAEADFQKLFKLLEIEFFTQKKSKFERALEIADLQ